MRMLCATIRPDHFKFASYGPVLGACFLPGTRHHLLSTYELNRVHDGSERLSETITSRTHSTPNCHSEINERRATQVFYANTKSQATSFAACDWPDYLLDRIKFLPYDA